jgi:hypothetical protein
MSSQALGGDCSGPASGTLHDSADEGQIRINL